MLTYIVVSRTEFQELLSRSLISVWNNTPFHVLQPKYSLSWCFLWKCWSAWHIPQSWEFFLWFPCGKCIWLSVIPTNTFSSWMKSGAKKSGDFLENFAFNDLPISVQLGLFSRQDMSCVDTLIRVLCRQVSLECCKTLILLDLIS